MEQLYSRLFGQLSLALPEPTQGAQLVQIYSMFLGKVLDQKPAEAIASVFQSCLSLAFDTFYTIQAPHGIIYFKRVIKIIIAKLLASNKIGDDTKCEVVKECLTQTKWPEVENIEKNLEQVRRQMHLVIVARYLGGCDNQAIQVIVKSAMQKILTNKIMQGVFIDEKYQEIDRQLLIRSNIKALTPNATKYTPTSGVDIVRVLNQWFDELNAKPSGDQKSTKAFRNLISIMAQLGNLQTTGNSLAIQFMIKGLTLMANAPKAKFQLDKLFLFFDAYSGLNDQVISAMITSCLTYINQQENQKATEVKTDDFGMVIVEEKKVHNWQAKLIQRLLKLPLSSTVTVILLQLFNAHRSYMIQQRTAHLQLLVHMMSDSVSNLTSKLIKSLSPIMRLNCLKLLRFFLLGYRMQPSYFLDYCDSRYLQVLENCKLQISLLPDVSTDELRFIQSLIDFLTTCMAVYSGHPEKYGEIQDRIGEIIYDSQGRLVLPAEADIERSKGDESLWIAIDQQDSLQNFESRVAIAEPMKGQEQKEEVKVLNKRRKGLMNLGNTCYMNSVLQALYQIKDFRDDLLCIDESLILLTKNPELEESGQQNAVPLQQKIKSGLFQLQRLFMQLSEHSVRNQIAPRQFKALALPDFFRQNGGYEQHDSQEFVNMFLDKIDRELKQSTELENLTQKYIEGSLFSQIQCQTCQNVSERKEPFVDLGLSFDCSLNLLRTTSDAKVSVQSLLESHFNDVLFEGPDNRYHCEICQSHVDLAIKKIRLHQVPPQLILTLNRFYFDPATLQKKKILTPVEVKNNLQVPYLLEDGKTIPLEYELQSVVIHAGTNANFGHYYTIAKDDFTGEENTKWRIYNDSTVTEIEQGISYLETLQRKFVNDTPYMLFYKRKEAGPQTSADTEMKEELLNQSEEKKEDVDMKEEQKESQPKQEPRTIAPHLLKWIEQDNKDFLQEQNQSSSRSQKDFNQEFFRQLQRSMRASAKNIDDDAQQQLQQMRRFGGGGGGGDFGGPSSGAGGFFGGGGGHAGF
ncbi:hypothetical protein FGO68_gene12743 [Halteria grandinella]|uniref:USP domain-containing protein n=1 Tax=Halteria grandinella TaxID=5974 RepID=A0A8J8P115_HALGN|nr:hypothetical protein FGO68_gene12743 [Halteria grandinella]